jgi:hypothetical protein
LLPNQIVMMLKPTLPLLLMAALLSACGSSSEKITVPTQGVIATVREVQKNQFKIEDEQSIADTAQSLVIAKWMDGQIDTFTLSEARILQSAGHHSHSGGIFHTVGLGYFGYMMGRSMASPVQSSAYVDPQTYNRVSNGAGQQIRSSAVTTTRPSAGRSGFGSRTGGGSTRSYGG